MSRIKAEVIDIADERNNDSAGPSSSNFNGANDANNERIESISNISSSSSRSYENNIKSELVEVDTYDSIPNDEYLDDFGTSSIVSMEDDVKSEAELMSAMLQAMKDDEHIHQKEVSGLEPECCCDVASPSHSGCQPVLLSNALKGLIPVDPLAQVQLHSPIEIMIYSHLGQQFPIGKARELAVKIMATEQPFRGYHMYCRDTIPSLIFSKATVKVAYETRLRACKVAYNYLVSSGTEPIRLHFKLALTKDDVDYRTFYEWRKLFFNVNMMIEEFRARLVHGFDHLIQSPVVMIGDGDGEQFNSVIKCLLLSGKNTEEIVTSVSRLAFASSVRHIVVCLGADDIRASIPVSKLMENMELLAEHLSRTGIKTTIVPPPFNVRQEEAHDTFLSALWDLFGDHATKYKNIQLALCRGFRSLAEITRYGKSYQRDNVSADGRLTKTGLAQTLYHLRAVYRVPMSLREGNVASGRVTAGTHLPPTSNRINRVLLPNHRPDGMQEPQPLMSSGRMAPSVRYQSNNNRRGKSTRGIGGGDGRGRYYYAREGLSSSSGYKRSRYN